MIGFVALLVLPTLVGETVGVVQRQLFRHEPSPQTINQALVLAICLLSLNIVLLKTIPADMITAGYLMIALFALAFLLIGWVVSFLLPNRLPRC
jgi:hypothetical protein